MSLKGEAYETTEEVKFRLESTVVLYDGAPVYISRVSMPEQQEEAKEIARVFFYELPYNPGVIKVKEQRKYLSSKKFDLAPFKMGYMNYNGQAVFTSRNPVRQNRQGLTANSCKITLLNKDDRGMFGFHELIACEGFTDMVAGKFPSFADAGDMLGDKKNSSVAISRSFAFHIDHDIEALLLLHKGVKCGIAVKGQKTLNLPPKFHFLREEAEECRIPLA